MSLSQRSRTALYLGLTGVIADEEAVEEMLSQFPSRDLDEPVTKELLRAEIAELRAEMHQGFQRLTLALIGSQISLAAVIVAAAASVE